MSQVTEQSVRFQTALASIKLIQASAVLDLTEDDFDFLTSNKVWIATDRSRARRCVEACVYGTLDFVGYPRFPAPVEFIAAVIAYYFLPFTIQPACPFLEGPELRQNLIIGLERAFIVLLYLVDYLAFLVLFDLLVPSMLIMFIPSTFKRPVSSWKALNLRKTLLMASSVRLKPLNCSRLPCVYAQETLTFLL